MSKIRFILIGSGWRALYYVRIAKALPDVLEVACMYCRREEKAREMALAYDIPTTTSKEECLGMQADFGVVAVTKSSIAAVSKEWMDAGLPILCETPAALDLPTLESLWSYYLAGKKLMVAEQYTHYPEYSALLSFLLKKPLGEITAINASLAHDYHGASLIRALLGEQSSSQFEIEARSFEFPTTETLSRYEKYTDGRIAMKKRVVANITWEDGKVSFYDFDSEQYRSPIRKNTLKITGVTGEIVDDKIYYLNHDMESVEGVTEVFYREVVTESKNPNFQKIREVTDVRILGSSYYEMPWGRCGLASDETAIARLLVGYGKYLRGEGPIPYALSDALSDAYVSICMQEALETGEKVKSKKQVWMEDAI